jgi:hypothetical protein
MQLVIVPRVLFACALIAVGACKTDKAEKENMGSKPTGKPAAGLEADPFYYKLNSVMGEVTSAGKPVPGAKVTIVKTGESFPIEASGAYVLVLDPVKLGGRGHEIAFSAPGYVEQKHFVMVPENNQTRLDVELKKQ